MEKVTEVTLMNVLDKDLMCFKHFSNLAWEGVSKIEADRGTGQAQSGRD